MKFATCLCLLVLLGCAQPIVIAADTSAAIDQPPPPHFCEPGESPNVSQHLVADCTAMTQEFGDWYLAVVKYGTETLGWSE